MPIPKSFQEIVNNLTILPGVGEKTAERYAYALLNKEKEEIESLADSILNFKNTIQNCEICGCISDEPICEICSDESRDKSVICIVEDSKNVFSIENTRKFKGLYHVINGLISPRDGINPEDLNIASLMNNRITSDTKEIIIALSPSIEGEVTSMYLQKILEKKDVKVSRLSYGIPMGSDFEYLDPLMIIKALDDRKTVK